MSLESTIRGVLSAQTSQLNENILEEKYEIFHKDFSGAMQHAYDYAKKKMGVTVDKNDIDNKVATGPKKPGAGKTNRYSLKTDKGMLQIQVYNKGGSKPFELNMYKEEVELGEKLDSEDKPVVKKVVKMLKKASQAHAGQADDLEKSMNTEEMDTTMDTTKHVMKNKETGKYCVYDTDNKKVAEFDSEDEANAYAKKNHDKLMKEEVEHIDDLLEEFFELEEDAKMGKQSDSNLKSLMKKFKNMPKSPANDHMLKRVEKEMKKRNLQEGTWHYPDAKQIAKFKKALGKKFILGRDKDESAFIAKDIIPFGDDELYDMLDDAADVNPKQDARPIFTRWINGRIRDNYGGYGKKTLAIAKKLGIREEVEMNENSDIKRFGLSQSLVDAVASIIAGKKPTNAKEDNTNDKSDDGEGLDKVQPKALKKKFDDRKDKDIDNDGDTDSSDKYMHKKRQAVSKAISKDDEKSDDKDEADTKADPKKKKKSNGEPVDTKPTINTENRADFFKKSRERAGLPSTPTAYRPKDIEKMAKDPKYKGNTSGLEKALRKYAGKRFDNNAFIQKILKKHAEMNESNLKEEMTDAQMKKREEIVKELKKKEDYFKEKYGEKADEVMYATATKMAMKGSDTDK